jgi:regulator of sigma E protease
MILTLIIFIAIFAILILVHELGHFIAAKKSGVKVEEFGLGFPPRIFGIRKGETLYSINWIPLGGFVKIFGEGGEGRGDKESFVSKSISRRVLILAAGVLMNFALAALLLGIGYKIGMPTVVDGSSAGAAAKNAKVQISDVAPDSPASNAGLATGDEIKGLKVQGEGGEVLNIHKAEEVTNFINGHKGQEVIFEVQRGKEILDLAVTPRENPPTGEGPVGIGLADVVMVSYPLLQSLWKGVVDMVNLTWLIIVTLAGIIHKALVGSPVGEVLTGPVGIYKITAQTTEMGFIYVLNLAALLSINLGIINILPFPALDGGRILFLGIEKIKGSPVSQKVENTIHTIGFALLIALMIFITYKDVAKFFF